MGAPMEFCIRGIIQVTGGELRNVGSTQGAVPPSPSSSADVVTSSVAPFFKEGGTLGSVQVQAAQESFPHLHNWISRTPGVSCLPDVTELRRQALSHTEQEKIKPPEKTETNKERGKEEIQRVFRAALLSWEQAARRVAAAGT